MTKGIWAFSVEPLKGFKGIKWFKHKPILGGGDGGGGGGLGRGGGGNW